MNLVAHFKTQQRWPQSSGLPDSTSLCLPARGGGLATALFSDCCGPCLLLAGGGVATYRSLHCFQPSVLGGLVAHRDHLSSPTWCHLFLCSPSPPLRGSRKNYSLPWASWREGRRVMRQNLHHSGSNFPSFVAKNKTCTRSSLPVGFLLGFH